MSAGWLVAIVVAAVVNQIPPEAHMPDLPLSGSRTVERVAHRVLKRRRRDR